MSSAIRVLFVGEDQPAIERSIDSVQHRRRALDVVTVSSPAEGLERLERTAIDCVVSECLPDESNALDFLEAVRARDPSLPFVLLTESSATTVAAEAIDAGVTDFVPRSDDRELGPELANRIVLAVNRGETAGSDESGESDGGDEIDTVSEADRRSNDDFPFDLERFRSFADTIADPIYVLDAEGYHVLVNDAHVEYTGTDREELVGTHASEFVDREAFERGTRVIASLLAAGQDRGAMEITVQRADGEERIGEAHVTVLTDDDGEYVGSVGIVRDVTERKEHVRELARYETIVETAPIGLTAIDEDGYVLWHNEEFTASFEEGTDELVGTHFSELTERGHYRAQTLDDYVERVRHLLSSANDDDQVSFEMETVDHDGEHGVSEVNMRLLPLEDGEFAGTVYAFRDVTERVEYERELERQNEHLEEFASLVSHDLRNPLNVAQGHLDLHADRCDDSALEEIEWSLDRMQDLIEDMLTLARHGQSIGDLEPVDLAAVVEDAWDAVDTADASLDCRLDETIRADRSRVRALFENLFRNSVEHGSTSPASSTRQDAVEHSSTSHPEPLCGSEDAVERDGDAVTVITGGVENADDSPIEAGTEPGWGFYVEDDGPGLPEDVDVFELGFTTDASGTGFGLGIVEGIAEAHEWTVTAGAGAAGGARFEFRGVTVLEE